MNRSDRIHINRWSGIFQGREFPCSVGRGGIKHHKTEGDGITPAGTFSLERIMYRPDKIAGIHVPRQTMAIRPFHIWSDDPQDPQYNTLQNITTSSNFSHERMYRADSLYDLVIPFDYNRTDPEPGKGSAIFLHVWRGPRIPTEGCVAVKLETLLWITKNLTSRTKIAIQA